MTTFGNDPQADKHNNSRIYLGLTLRIQALPAMHDLIVDTIGAVIVALMGWPYARTGRYSFIADGVGSFVRNNGRFFGPADDAERPDQESSDAENRDERPRP